MFVSLLLLCLPHCVNMKCLSLLLLKGSSFAAHLACTKCFSLLFLSYEMFESPVSVIWNVWVSCLCKSPPSLPTLKVLKTNQLWTHNDQIMGRKLPWTTKMWSLIALCSGLHILLKHKGLKYGCLPWNNVYSKGYRCCFLRYFVHLIYGVCVGRLYMGEKT